MINKACNLYLWDAFKLIQKLPDNSVDLILTDPPYNLAPYSTGNIELKRRKDINNDLADWDNVDFDPARLVKEFKRVLKPDGNIFAFTSYNLVGKRHSSFDPVFDTFQFMVWHKTNPTPNFFKKWFLNSCELIMCMWDKGHKRNFSDQRSMHNFVESGICMGNERVKWPDGKSLHPTQKPVGILQHIIKIASNPWDVVFDPFMGVWSTGEAALALGRKFVGFDLEKVYFEAAQKRLWKPMAIEYLHNQVISEKLAQGVLLHEKQVAIL